MTAEVYQITLQGLKLQRAYVEAASLNIANANQISGNKNLVAKPFSVALQPINGNKELTEIKVLEQNVTPKAIYQPDNSQADSNGFVYSTDINMVEQMLMLNKANRAYEANIKAFNAYREMGKSAMQIGK